MQPPSAGAAVQLALAATTLDPLHTLNGSRAAADGGQTGAATSAAGRGDVVILVSMVYVVIFVIGVVGNLCNCLVIADAHNRYMKSATNYYLFSLSVSDLLLLIFGIPHDLVDLWHPSSYLFNEFVCVSRGWISEASTNASVLVIVAFTMERYLAICHPLRLRTFSRLSRSVRIIVLIWVLASTSALLVVRRFGLVTTQVSAGSPAAGGQVVLCTTLNQEESASDFELSVIVFFVIPMLVISVLYIKICCYLRHKTNIIMRGRRARVGGQRQLAADPKTVEGDEEEEGEEEDRLGSEGAHFSTLSGVSQLRMQSASPTALGPADEAAGRQLQTQQEVELDLEGAPVAPWLGPVTRQPEVQWYPMVESQLASTPLPPVVVVASDANFPAEQAFGARRANQSAGYSQDSGGGVHLPPRSRPTKGSGAGKLALQSTVNTANLQSVIKMLVSVVVMFFICWAPFHAQRLMAVYVTDPTPDQEFVYVFLNHISGISYYISAVANPILYSLFSIKFRQAFRDTFRRLADKT